MTPITAALIALLCARHIPQFLIDMRNRGREAAYVTTSAIRASFIAGLYATALLAAVSKVVAEPTSSPSLIAVGCIFTGTIFGMSGLRALGANYAEELLLFNGAPLISSGIYGVIRHPLRLGLSLEIIGFATLADDPLLVSLVALTIVAQVIRSREEVDLLHKAFGTTADEYVRRVPAINFPLGLLRWWQVRSRARKATILCLTVYPSTGERKSPARRYRIHFGAPRDCA